MFCKNGWKMLFAKPLKLVLSQFIILLYLYICVDQTISSTENNIIFDEPLTLAETNQSHRQSKCKSTEILC